MNNPDAETEFCAKRTILLLKLCETPINFRTCTCIKAVLYRPTYGSQSSTFESKAWKHVQVFDYYCRAFISACRSTSAAKMKIVKSRTEHTDTCVKRLSKICHQRCKYTLDRCVKLCWSSNDKSIAPKKRCYDVGAFWNIQPSWGR